MTSQGPQWIPISVTYQWDNFAKGISAQYSVSNICLSPSSQCYLASNEILCTPKHHTVVGQALTCRNRRIIWEILAYISSKRENKKQSTQPLKLRMLPIKSSSYGILFQGFSFVYIVIATNYFDSKEQFAVFFKIFTVIQYERHFLDHYAHLHTYTYI